MTNRKKPVHAALDRNGFAVGDDVVIISAADFEELLRFRANNA